MLGLFALITGSSAPRTFRELFLLPLDIYMHGQAPFADNDAVIPPNIGVRARTLVLCFDGTGDHFKMDVRAYMLSPSSHVRPANRIPSRIQIS